jgi:NADPH:quinone reductase-like Zn-dependent oxidoreductase/malonyl CoA-acyl carrier protein transacylase/SAM-dependent methyltransferase
MGQELLAAYPVFSEAMATAEQQLAGLGAGWSLLEELSSIAGESRINEAAISQPCCTAVQIALVNLLRSWGILPTVVCGHSSGEIAAAYAAGFLSDYNALSIAFFRGQAVAKLKTQHPKLDGGMMAVGLSAADAQQYISKHGSDDPFAKVVVACINSPTSVTLSGDKPALRLIQTDLEACGIFNRLLTVDVAYHSHHMGLARKDYIALMTGLKPLQSDNSIRMISSVTGREINGQELDADYWADNMVSTVRFSEALEGALTPASGDGHASRPSANMILEVGPHSALAGPIKQTLKSMANQPGKVSYHSILLRNVNAVKTAVDMSGELFSLGCNNINFLSINDPHNIADKKTLVNLPVYNWQHSTSHWSESRTSTQFRLRQFARHELLGVKSNDSIPTEPTWRNYVGVTEMPWLSGHVINDQMIFPASGYICMAVEALRQLTLTNGIMWKNVVCRFRQIVVGRALLIPENSRVETFFTLRRYASSTQDSSSNWKEFQVFSMSATGEDTEHCRGLVCVDNHDSKDDIETSQEYLYQKESTMKGFKDAQNSCRQATNVEKYYSDLKSIGMSYTGPFSSITQINTQPLGSLCTIKTPDTKSAMPGEYQQSHVLHPATLDMCFQTVFPALMAETKMASSVVISGIDELIISSDISSVPGTDLLTHATIEPFGRLKYRANIAVGDPKLRNPSLISIKGLRANSTYELSSSHNSQNHDLCHQLEWGLDTTCAKQDDVNKLCVSGLEPNPTTERRNTFDSYIRHVIQQVLSIISAEDEAAMATHHRKLVHWMRSQEQGLNTQVDPNLKELVQSLGADGKMLVQVADHLVDILTGKIDPLTVMMKDDLLYQLYVMENIQRCHTELANYLRQLQFKNPRMRILEIGAGTASMSIIALDALTGDPETRRPGKEKLDKYVFTDISSGFFEKGKAVLADWGELVEFKKLDIEKSVTEQGFEAGSFDLVIASNVLHATQTMAKTMQNVRTLLKPDGKLTLVEITETNMFWHMTVGILPGWWLGAEDGRIDSPLLTLPKWNSLLHETGFSGIDAKMKDFESAHEHQVSLMISTAIAPLYENDQPSIEIVCSEKENSIAGAFCELVVATTPQRQVQQSSLDTADFSNKICVILLEILVPFLRSCTESEFQHIKSMFGLAKGILWVTKGGAIEAVDPEKALVTGLARTLRSEDHALNIVTLDLDPKTANPAEIAKHILEVVGNAFRPQSESGYFREFEYAIRNGQILIPRVVENVSLERYVRSAVNNIEPAIGPLNQEGRALGLEIQTPGILDSLYWMDSPNHSRQPYANEVRIEVNMVALNFKDLMNAMGQLPGLSAMLIECCGTVIEVGSATNGEFKVGDRVCAIHPDGIATRSNIDYRQVRRIPDGMSMELATAIPISYATALYALRDAARIQKGDSVLIHAAAGALGQAAIAIAQYYQAGEIFVTVGTPEKRALIKEQFGIADENIFSSRTLAFGQGIQRRTKGRGVDIVLNSLSGEATRESQNCLAQFGRFVEVGKKDLLSNARMETQYLEKNATFSAVDLGMVAQHKPLKFQEILGTILDLIQTQKLQALTPITLLPISELEAAFRQMQTGKHVGKLILQIKHNSQVMVCFTLSRKMLNVISLTNYC